VVLAILLLRTAPAQVTQAWSVNIGGVARVVVPTNGSTQAGMPWQPLGQSMAVSNVIGGQLPQGSSLYLWDIVSNTLITCNRAARGGWSSGGLLIPPGAGFWLTTYNGAGSTGGVHHVFLAGEVPSADTQPELTLSPVAGTELIAYGYPVSTVFTGTTLYGSGVAGDFVMVWHTDTQAYTTNILTGSGWQPPLTGLVIRPGNAFWYGTSNSIAWVETKPYTWP